MDDVFFAYLFIFKCCSRLCITLLTVVIRPFTNKASLAHHYLSLRLFLSPQIVSIVFRFLFFAFFSPSLPSRLFLQHGMQHQRSHVAECLVLFRFETIVVIKAFGCKVLFYFRQVMQKATDFSDMWDARQFNSNSIKSFLRFSSFEITKSFPENLHGNEIQMHHLILTEIISASLSDHYVE